MDRGKASPLAFAALSRALLAIGCLCHAAPGVEADDRPSVLFICVDDLRPQLGCYGEDGMVTPHLDRFAASARLFRYHYAQVPTCGASRFALMTGRQPRVPRALGNGAFTLLSGKEGKDPESLPRLFRRQGYYTVSIGKVSHSPDGRKFAKEKEGGDGSPEMPLSWDEIGTPAGKWKTGWSAFFGYADGSGRERGKSPATEIADVDDRGYPDGLIADAAVKKLRELKGRPFFLAVGFYKPHLPFNAPKKYWDLYTREGAGLAPHPGPPAGVDPSISLHKSPELLRNYGSHPNGRRVDPPYARRLRHAYFACVSYVDAQVGKVLHELEELSLDRKTVVVVWGDHGWHLGDLGVWGKHTLYERALRSVLIVRTPDMKSPGEATKAIVETVDLYPTLAELCGLEAPGGLDGHSLLPLLENPRAEWRNEARGYWRLGGRLGRTLRTERYRLAVWKEKGVPVQVELYDHRASDLEVSNIASKQPDIVARLLERLRAAPGPKWDR